MIKLFLASILAANLGVMPRPVSTELTGGETSNLAIQCEQRAGIPAEGYELEVTPSGVVIRSSDKSGEFYARKTLEQLTFNRKTVPCCKIVDHPRFQWRSLLLDVSRHFFTVDEVKRFIDQMARFKFNVLHWHLVDSHGWRMEIPKYPALTQRGAWRYDGGMDPNGKPYGGYYTTAQLKDIVKYAADRCVTIVPEIDVPGHSAALTYALPNLACDPEAASKAESCAGFSCYPTRNYKRHQSVHPKIYGNGKVTSPDVVCVGKEESFKFFEDVMDEVMRIFPSKYVHIGGDEVQTKYWASCDKCLARVKEIGGDDVKSLMPYTANRIASYLQKHGRQAVGWDDILDGGMPQGTIVQSWRGTSGAVKAARANVKCIMSPANYMYFCYCQGDEYYEPDAHAKFVPLALTYSLDPIPKLVRQMGREDCVIGVEACLWSEYLNESFQLDVQTWPRALAVSEHAWSDGTDRNFIRFERDLECIKPYLTSLGIDYYDELKDYHGWDLYDNDPLPEKTVRPDTPTEAFMKEARKLYPRLNYCKYTNTIATAYLKRYVKKGDDPHSLETGLSWKRIPFVHNVRDIGGWNGLKPGRVFRGSQLYTNEVGGVSESTREAFAKLGIRTDLDLRGWDECEPHNKETLNFDRVGLKSIKCPISSYMKVWKNEESKADFRKALLVFADEKNYPIYFHCKAGADRTGTLAWVIEGLCGARETDLAIDYELTSFAKVYGNRLRCPFPLGSGKVDHFRELMDYVNNFPGLELRDKFASMVKCDFGLTDEQIAVIRTKLASL